MTSRNFAIAAFSCLLVGGIVLVAPACTPSSSGGSEPAAANSPAAAEQQRRESIEVASKVKVNAQSKNIVYTWVDEDGQFKSTEVLNDIPAMFRNDVLLVDLNLSPEVRKSTRYAIVADLTRTDPEGFFVVRAEPRADFERAIALKRQYKLTSLSSMTGMPADQGPLPGGPLPPVPVNKDSVILYSTSWCQYCKNMRAVLDYRQVPYVEKDIEKDPAAARELLAKTRAAGVGDAGVPVVDYKGSLIVGYNPQALAAAVEKDPSVSAPPTPKATP